MAEILTMVRDKVQKKGYLKRLFGGVVLTGGGALMPGAVELAQEVFHTAARVGVPGNYHGVSDVYRSPEFSTAVGLVLFADEAMGRESGEAAARPKTGGMLTGLRTWLRNFFE
jgi:cell division protein FtsA